MNKPKVRSNINHIIKMADSVVKGENTINKRTSDSDYQKHIYAPEAILANIKVSAESALKALNEYE